MNLTPSASTIIAVLVLIGFFAIVLIVLIGFVDIGNPEIAKLVGVIVGYLTALLNPIVMSYFKNGGSTR
jgi:hypothetical protein